MARYQLCIIYIIIRLNHVIRGKSHDAWHASSKCMLLETFSQRRIQHLPTAAAADVDAAL